MDQHPQPIDSAYLNDRLSHEDQEDPACDMAIVFVDIVSYSQRITRAQKRVIDAFVQCLRAAFDETARVHLSYLSRKYLHLPRDLVVVPAGDGAAIGFPFQGQEKMPITFVRTLFEQVERHNCEESCQDFESRGWCHAHSHFALRCGLAEGKVILFRDVNGGYNMAGTPVNMASRVMNIAGARQVFLAEEYVTELRELIPDFENQLQQYEGVIIKHNLAIDPYQYIAESLGIDTSKRNDLTLWVPRKEHKAATARLRSSTPSGTPIVKRISQPRVVQREVALSTAVKAIQSDLVLVPYDGVAITDPSRPSRILPIASSFLIGKHAITQAVYCEVMGTPNPSRFQGDQRPVETVSWEDAIKFCNRLSELAGLAPVYQSVDGTWNALFDQNGYRLPTEAEWEYACTNGGKETSFQPLDRFAWYGGEGQHGTHNVGEKDPTCLGLCDMLGNVSEWCHDKNDRSCTSEFLSTFGGPTTGYERVTRGGSWISMPSGVTPYHRNPQNPGTKSEMVGFRVARRA